MDTWDPSRLQETLAGIELLLRDIRHQLPQSDGGTSGWSKVGKTLQDIDEEKIRYCKEDIDTLLTFAGLFSAALTAFLVESYTQLSEDPTTPVVQLLSQLVVQTRSYAVTNGKITSAATSTIPSQPFEPSASAICVNVLWFASLIVSLVTASFGILIKQWLREYSTVSNPQHTSLRARLRIRQFRNPALATWKVFEIAAVLPLLIQIALGLFLLGLCFFTWAVHLSVGGTAVPLVSAWFVFFVAAALAPAISADCPYKITLLAPLLRAIRALICSNPLTRRLYRGYLISANLIHDFESQNETPRMSLSHLVGIHPLLHKADFRSSKVAEAERHDLLPRVAEDPTQTVIMANVPLEEDQVARDESKDQGMLITVDNALLDDELLAATMIPLLQQNQATRATMMGFILTTIVHRIPRLRSATDGYYQTADFKRMSVRTWSVFVDLIIAIIGSDTLDDVSASDGEWLQGTLAVLHSCPEGYPFSSVAASVLTRTTQSLYKSVALQRAGSPSLPFRDVWAICRRVIPAKSFKPVAVMSALLSSQYCHDQCHHDGLFDVIRSHHTAISGDTHAICSILVKTMQSNSGGTHSFDPDQDDVAQVALTLSFAWLTEKALLHSTLVERIVRSLYTALPDPQDFYSTILHPLMLRMPKLRRGTEGYQRVDLSSFNLRRDTWDFYMRLVQYASVSLSNDTISSTGAQRGWIEGTVAMLQSCSDHYPLTTSVALVYEGRFKKLFFESMALGYWSLRFKGTWPIIMRTFGPEALSCRTDFIYQLLQTVCCKDCADQRHAGLLELLSHHIQTLHPDVKDICDALDQQFMKDEINTIHWTRDLEEALLVFIACLVKNNLLFDLQVLEYGKNLNTFLSETTKYPAVLEPMLNAFARRVPAFRIRIEGYNKERPSIDMYRTVVNLTGLSRYTWDLYLDILSRPINVVALRRSRPDLLEGTLALLNSRSADYPLTDSAKRARDLLSGTFLQSMREFVQIQSKGHDIPDVLISCSRLLVQDDLDDPSAFLFDLLFSRHCRNASPACNHQDLYAAIEAHSSPRARLGIARFLTDHVRQSYPRAPGIEWQVNTLTSLVLLCRLMHHIKKSDLNDYDKPCSLVSVLLRQPVITLSSFTTVAVESILQVPDAWIRVKNFKNTSSTGRQIHLQNLAYLLKRYSSRDVSNSSEIHILACCETSLEALHTALQEIPDVIQEDAILWEDFMKQMASALNVFYDRNGGTSKIHSESAIRCLGTCTSLLLQTRKSGRMLGMSVLVSALHDYLMLPYDDLRCLRDIVSDEPRIQSVPGRHPLPLWPEVSDEDDDRASAWIEDDDNSSFYF